jgi:defect-in-organelle-trafficking protein DotD
MAGIMKRSALFALVASLVTLGLTGCGPSHHNYMLLKYVTTDSAPVPAVDKNAQAQIAEAASSVSQNIQNLDAMTLATHKNIQMPTPVNAAHVGMAQIVSVSWHGPVEPLLKQIAAGSHYKVRVVGTAPSIPLLVNVNAENEALAEVLRDATYQVAKEATVQLYPKQRVIELRYHI